MKLHFYTRTVENKTMNEIIFRPFHLFQCYKKREYLVMACML